jgi:membrane protease YdiL (CAAX protease family)
MSFQPSQNFPVAKRLVVAISPWLAFYLFNGFLKAYLFKISLQALWGFDAVVCFVAFPTFLWGFARYAGVTFEAVGLQFGRSRTNKQLLEDAVVCTIALGFINFFAGSVAYGYLHSFDWFHTSPYAFSWGLAMDVENRAILVLYASITAAVMEEFIFRGLLCAIVFRLVTGKRAATIFCLLSSFLFGIAHWEAGLVSVVGTCVFGWVAARLYLWTKHLLPLIVAHFVVDMFAFW